MTGEAYLSALQAFTEAHKIPRDVASRLRKAGEELGELSEAAMNHDIPALTEEACDLVNVSIDLLTRVVGTKLLWQVLVENLITKDAKYLAGARRTEERK